MSEPNHGWSRHVHACNLPVTEPLHPWLIEGQIVGWVRPSILQLCAEYPGVFVLADQQLELDTALTDFDQRTQALADATEHMARAGHILPPMGEPFPVTPAGREQAKCIIDRSASAYFGVRSFGQHLNGIVHKPDGLYMWIGRRARDRLIFPGKLDQMVAGGLPWGVSLEENLLKEAHEEASVPGWLAAQAQAVSVVTYNRLAERGFRPDVIYCYDLELPEDFVPQNHDGEVEEFQLLPIGEVMRLVLHTDEFKLNCNLVIVDFLLRQGYISPDHPEYLALSIGLRQPSGMPGFAGVGK